MRRRPSSLIFGDNTPAHEPEPEHFAVARRFAQMLASTLDVWYLGNRETGVQARYEPEFIGDTTEVISKLTDGSVTAVYLHQPSSSVVLVGTDKKKFGILTKNSLWMADRANTGQLVRLKGVPVPQKFHDS
jgi:hypothetical protein